VQKSSIREYRTLHDHLCENLKLYRTGSLTKMKPRRKWEDNIKMNLREMELGSMGWTHLA
jgi:hypothetical protein